MVVKQGYKQTEIGIIPDDWLIAQIQELLDNKSLTGHLDGNHGSLYPKSNEFTDHGIPYIGATDFGAGLVSFSNCKFLSEKRASKFRKGISISGDVLFAHNATVGPVSFLDTKLDFVILSTTATYFRCNSKFLDNKYLLYALQATTFKSQYTAVMAQSTRFQVPITAQRKLFLIIPSLTEQSLIATALSDTDSYISSLEKLIAKKSLIKQGAMQELFTPKSHWVVKKLSEIGRTYGGLSGKTKVDFQNGLYPYIPFMNIMSNPVINTTSFDFVNIKSSENQNNALKEDLFFNGSSETPEEVGMCSVLFENIENLYLNSFCFGFRLSSKIKMNPLYLSYFFRSSSGRKLMFSSAQGATRYNLSKSNFLNLFIQFPSHAEQTFIATIISDMDSEIQILQNKLSKAHQLKQGMMQQLLTGKIRLV